MILNSNDKTVTVSTIWANTLVLQHDPQVKIQSYTWSSSALCTKVVSKYVEIIQFRRKLLLSSHPIKLLSRCPCLSGFLFACFLLLGGFVCLVVFFIIGRIT